MTGLASLAAIAASVALIVWLWHGDPKRRRVAGLPGKRADKSLRRVAAGAALVPGVALAALGDSAAFMVWLGGCAIGGWLVSQMRDGASGAE